MSTIYITKKVQVTGTIDVPQTIKFSELESGSERALPTEFQDAPSVGIGAPYQGRMAKIVKDSVTTEQFRVAVFDYGIALDEYYFSFIIIGDT